MRQSTENDSVDATEVKVKLRSAVMKDQGGPGKESDQDREMDGRSAALSYDTSATSYFENGYRISRSEESGVIKPYPGL